MKVIVELFKKYQINSIIIALHISLVFMLDENIDNIINFSYIDFSTINNSEFQFNVGLQSNNLVKGFYYFSVDKLLSNNLVGSIKISKYERQNTEIYNQNTLSLIPENSLLQFFIGINYISVHQRISKWINYGILLNYDINSKNSLVSGMYIDTLNHNNELWNSLNYYLCAKFSLNKKIINLLSIKYNPYYSIINQSLELSISL